MLIAILISLVWSFAERGFCFPENVALICVLGNKMRKCRLRDQELPSPLKHLNNCVYLKYLVFVFFVWGVC
ncbi:hypothetical protein HMPREF1579_01061 [Gardnerella vaginalis JCP8066]|nr:hypothetical protein HMPREF1579_01061 [Gardnerella vaginalis JCP8066]